MSIHSPLPKHVATLLVVAKENLTVEATVRFDIEGKQETFVHNHVRQPQSLARHRRARQDVSPYLVKVIREHCHTIDRPEQTLVGAYHYMI